MAASRIIISFIFLTTFASNSHQLQCYECTEGVASETQISTRDINAPCGNYSESLLVNCSSSAQVCEKNEGTVDGKLISIHFCGTTESDCAGRDGSRHENITISCYSCEGDGCNTAPAILFAAYLLVIAMIAPTVVY